MIFVETRRHSIRVPCVGVPRGSYQLFQPVSVANEVGKTFRQFEHWAISSQGHLFHQERTC